jgi:Ala-tRNA(Pro) deacylase
MTVIQHFPASSYLRRHDVPFALAPHREVFTGSAEARALGLPAADVLKAVVLRVSNKYVLAVIPASMQVDMELARKATENRWTRLATEDEIAENFPGYQLGALPPLPGLLGIVGYVDPSVLEHDAVAFADGRQTQSVMANPREIYWGEKVFVVPLATSHEITPGWWFEGDSVKFEKVRV